MTRSIRYYWVIAREMGVPRHVILLYLLAHTRRCSCCHRLVVTEHVGEELICRRCV